MGRAKLRLKRVELGPFDKGFFPNKDFEDVPDGGSSDCKHVLWYRSALRKMFGMDRINSSQAATTRGNGIFYLDVNGATKRVGVFGNKFYEDVSGTWTDKTGAITITDGAANLVQFVNWQQGANKYLIGVNNVDAPFKWTGAGNAAVLGGSPPANFGSVAVYHQTVFGSKNESVYFSDTADPETWNSTKWVINYTRNVSRVLEHGPKLAVMMDTHIGSIQGYDYLDFVSEEVEVGNVGCAGRLAATNARFGKSDTRVIVTVHKDGIWMIDEAFGAQKLLGDNYFSDFNQANLSKAVCCFSGVDKLLYVALPKDATENDYLIVIDMNTGAFWPCPSIHTNSIRSMHLCQDDSNNEWVYFVDTNGYAFKFNRDTTNYHTGTATQAIDARFKSKRFDLKDVHSLRDTMMLADADGDWNVTVACGFGLTADDGNTGSINLQDDSDLLGSSFILGASTLGGSDYIFKILSGVGGFGRFFSITFTNANASESFHIKKIELQLRRRRMGSNDK